MAKIEKLTDEQIALMPKYRDEWIKIGLSTEPVDLEKAKAAVCLAYEIVGLKKPTQFYVTDSPISAIAKIQELDPSLSKSTIFNSMIYGSNDAAWLAFYTYFRDVVGLECCKKLDGLIELAKHTGWLNVYEDVVVFQHRPKHIKFDDQNRLHCEDGPSILYRDGFSVFSWHGTRIPPEWIKDKASLTAKTALTWSNIEQRRCACEIVGWANILRQLKAKTINADQDPQVGTLVEVNLPDVGNERFLIVQCGTKREFALPVPPEMKTALEANAWTFGMDVHNFKIPEIRT